MRARDVLVGGERLAAPETATAVRCWDEGDVVVADGPFAETRNRSSAFSSSTAKDLNQAIEVATKIPTAWFGTIEVRPAWEM
jgi:hypothetical protein